MSSLTWRFDWIQGLFPQASLLRSHCRCHWSVGPGRWHLAKKRKNIFQQNLTWCACWPIRLLPAWDIPIETSHTKFIRPFGVRFFIQARVEPPSFTSVDGLEPNFSVKYLKCEMVKFQIKKKVTSPSDWWKTGLLRFVSGGGSGGGVMQRVPEHSAFFSFMTPAGDYNARQHFFAKIINKTRIYLLSE